MHGDNFALVTMLDGFFGQQLGITLARQAVLVNMGVQGFTAILLSRLKEYVQVLGLVALVFLWQTANYIDEFGPDFKPFPGFGIQHALDDLVDELDLYITFEIVPGLLGGFDSFVLDDRIHIYERAKGLDTLGAHGFYSPGHVAVDIVDAGFGLEFVRQSPFLLQRRIGKMEVLFG